MSQYLTPGWFYSEVEDAFSFLQSQYGCRVDSCTYKDLCFYEVFKNDVVGVEIELDWDMYLCARLWKLIDGKIPHAEVEVDPDLVVKYKSVNVYWIAKHRDAIPEGFSEVLKPNRESIKAGLRIQAAMLADVGADFLRGRFESYADLFVDETMRGPKRGRE